MFFAYNSNAQLNPESIFFKGLAGQQIVLDIYSDEPVQPCYYSCGVFDNIEFPSNEIITPQEGLSRLKLDFTNDFTGSFVLPVEYYKIEGIHKEAFQTNIHITIVNSILDPVHDYQSSLDNQTVFLNVTYNDVTSHPPLNVIDIPYSDGGFAYIIGNQIRFDPESEATGMAYFNYVVENAVGERATGTASVCLLSDNVGDIDTLDFVTTNKNSLSILLPTDGFSFVNDQLPSIGNATFVGGDVIEYIAPVGSEGVDEFHLVDNDQSKLRIVRVTNIDDEDRKATKDDVFYLYKGQKIVFNVLKNDLQVRPISAYSNGLIHLGSGIFEYQADQDFSGIKSFSYETTQYAKSETAKITLIISNFYPVALSKYSFTTRQGQPLLLNYDSPLSGFDFDVTSNVPNHGSLTIENGNSSFINECGTEQGTNLVIYSPQSEFIGIDEFEINYCPQNEECVVISIEVDVIPYQNDCACIGSGCVWPGDLDNDGQVSVVDVLSLGYGIGVSGEPRLDNGAEWQSQISESWSVAQVNSVKDAKHLDANGDGVANVADTIAVSDFYNRHHNLLPDLVPIQREYPFYLTLSDYEPEIGDFLNINVHWGSDDSPVLDVHGLAYSLNISNEVFDSSSLVVNHLENQNWLGNNSPTINMDFNLANGRLDIVSTRTSGSEVSGSGIIHELGSIIIDEVDGFKLEDDYYTIPVKVENIRFTDGSGQLFSLPDYETSFKIKLSRDDLDVVPATDRDLFVYPNPSSGVVNVYLNNDIISEYSITDSAGRIITVAQGLNTNTLKINTEQIQNGIYFLSLKTSNSILNKRIQIYR